MIEAANLKVGDKVQANTRFGIVVDTVASIVYTDDGFALVKLAGGNYCYNTEILEIME